MVSGYLTSLFHGGLNSEQIAFASHQKTLFATPTTSQYMLFVFTAATVLFSYFLPNILGPVIGA